MKGIFICKQILNLVSPKIVKFNIGDRVTIKQYNVNAFKIEKNNGDYVNLSFAGLKHYFEPIQEKRNRIINEIV